MTQTTFSVESQNAERIAWDHALHEERVLNERAGLFLVAEAMMLVFYATLGVKTSSVALQLFAAIGFVMSLLWITLNMRQHDDLLCATDNLKRVSSFYRDYIADREVAGWFRKWDRPVLVYALPLLVAVVWLVLFLDAGGFLA